MLRVANSLFELATLAELARLMPVHWNQSRETRFRMKLTERGSDLSWLNPADRIS